MPAKISYDYASSEQSWDWIVELRRRTDGWPATGTVADLAPIVGGRAA